MDGLSVVKHKFTQEEDEELKRLAKSLSCNWRQISKLMPGRTARQCRERYKYFLSPNICQEKWTEVEDTVLREKFLEYGPKWATIAQYLDGRTPVMAKNRFKKLSRNRKMSQKKRIYYAKEHEISSDSDDGMEFMKSNDRTLLSLPAPISQMHFISYV